MRVIGDLLGTLGARPLAATWGGGPIHEGVGNEG